MRRTCRVRRMYRVRGGRVVCEDVSCVRRTCHVRTCHVRTCRV